MICVNGFANALNVAQLAVDPIEDSLWRTLQGFLGQGMRAICFSAYTLGLVLDSTEHQFGAGAHP